MRLNKKRLSVWSIFVSLILLVATISVSCSSLNSSPQISESVLDRMVSQGNLKAGYVVYPPTVIAGKEASKPSGFLIDLMNEIATRGNFKVSYEETTFDNIQVGLTTNRFDVVVGGIFKTIPRATTLASPRTIMYWAGTMGVTKSQNVNRFPELSSLNRPQVKIAVTSGTAEHEWVKKELPNANVQALQNEDISLTLAEVVSGRADVAFADAVTIRAFLQRNQGISTLFDDKQFNSFAVSFVVRKEDNDLLQFLDTSLEVLEVDGTTQEISKKYKGETIWDLPVSPRKHL